MCELCDQKNIRRILLKTSANGSRHASALLSKAASSATTLTRCCSCFATTSSGSAWGRIGIARRESGDDFDSLYRKADAALYQRKEALGRDGYTIYGDGADS